ncbi:unnamed protein product [Absidia cylindrospora]
MTDNIPLEMKALVLEAFGPPEALKYTTVPVPKLRNPTNVLVKVHAAGLNPVESHMRSGNMFTFLVKKNAILGSDYSGVIVAKGSGVPNFEVNDAVFGTLKFPCGPQGSYAEYIVVDTAADKAIAKKPDNLSFLDAASVGVATLTALEGVVCKRPLPLEYNGEEGARPKVLVIGASGGVGMYGVQIAKTVGAEVVGICSGKNVSLVKGFGADRVVDYNDKKAMDDLANNEKDSFDVVFDLVGGDDYYQRFMPLVKPKTGMFSTAVGPTAHNGATKLGVLDYLSFGGTIFYRQFFASRRYSMILNVPQDQFASVIAPWLEQKKLGTLVSEENIFDLKDGNKAHEKIESQRTVGKIVLRVIPDA